jgi:mevalonate kinase
MADEALREVIRSYGPKALGWKLSGAGGGGYLVVVAEQRFPGTIGIKIRRPPDS